MVKVEWGEDERVPEHVINFTALKSAYTNTLTYTPKLLAGSSMVVAVVSV